MTKPNIPKGTRDFLPEQMARRNYIFNTIRDVFHLYGFEQIETPAMETMQTLMGKYGEEGDKLLFRIQNSGEKAGAAPEKGLRYDLTVPFARLVTQYRNEIHFPFKRFQIQPVWRADRPQKGRYREFYQCDVDIIGTKSLIAEMELMHIVADVYHRLGINVCLKLNNRKILAGIAEVIGEPDRLIDITTAIDKMDKIGKENVNTELIDRGLSTAAVERLQPVLELQGSNRSKLAQLRDVLAESEVGLQGISEVEQLFDLCDASGVDLMIELDLTLARGLNYYTGAIFEVKALDVEMGSITGGGRYDNLTGVFGMPDVSGVGISFGADRIYDVLTELDLFPDDVLQGTKVIFLSFGEDELRYALSCASRVRATGISTEVYPEPAKIKKQLAYADAKHIPYVAIVGSEEIQNAAVTLKNMLTGEQKSMPLNELIDILHRS